MNDEECFEMCPVCIMFLADGEHGVCCSETCDGIYRTYLEDLDDHYLRDHLTHWSEL